MQKGKAFQCSINYDEEADVLYINFLDDENKIQEADESMRSGDFILRVKDRELIGVTIIDFKHKITPSFFVCT